MPEVRKKPNTRFYYIASVIIFATMIDDIKAILKPKPGVKEYPCDRQFQQSQT
jgi:hypothetical protein